MSNICCRWFFISTSLNCIPILLQRMHTIANFLKICCSKSYWKKYSYIKIRWSQTCKSCHLQWARCPTHSWEWGICAFCRFLPTVFLWIPTSFLYTQIFHRNIIRISSYVRRACFCCFVNFHILVRTIHPLRSGGPNKGPFKKNARIRHVITTL